VRPAPFDYVRPASVEDARAALDGGGTALAGGQSLLPLMKLRRVRPRLLVDLNGLAGLRGIEDGRIGAMTRHQEVADAAGMPLLAEAARRTGDVQVRARGTIGGNVCFADPRANMSTALIAAGAVAVVAGEGGERRAPVEELFAGLRRTSLAPGELLVAFEVDGADGAYEELTVQPNGVPIVNAAVCGGRVAVGGLLRTPCLIEGPEAPEREAAERAVAAAVDGGEPLADLQGNAAYRARVAAVLIVRALRATQTEEARP
jgi:aerobic carbon-monoxide dehydrogenase medium subunit